MALDKDDPSAEEILRCGFDYDPSVNTLHVDKFLQKIFPRHGENSMFDKVFPKHLKIMGCSKSVDGEQRICVFSDVYDTTKREHILVHLCESQGYRAELIEYDYNAHEFKSGYILPPRICKKSHGYDCIYRGKLVGVRICAVPILREVPNIVETKQVVNRVFSIVKESLSGESYKEKDSISVGVRTSRADDQLVQIIGSILSDTCFCANLRVSRTSYFVWDDRIGYYSLAKTIKYLESDVRSVIDHLIAEWDRNAINNENKWLRDRAIQQSNVKSWNKRISDRVRSLLKDDVFVRMAKPSMSECTPCQEQEVGNAS
tara:strand:+ start:72 stop:1019 length:948 start_codon:yes stop_codon:yes gene_type:complete